MNTPVLPVGESAAEMTDFSYPFNELIPKTRLDYGLLLLYHTGGHEDLLVGRLLRTFLGKGLHALIICYDVTPRFVATTNPFLLNSPGVRFIDLFAPLYGDMSTSKVRDRIDPTYGFEKEWIDKSMTDKVSYLKLFDESIEPLRMLHDLAAEIVVDDYKHGYRTLIIHYGFDGILERFHGERENYGIHFMRHWVNAGVAFRSVNIATLCSEGNDPKLVAKLSSIFPHVLELTPSKTVELVKCRLVKSVDTPLANSKEIPIESLRK